MAPNSNTQKPRLKIRALSAAVATCFAAAPASKEVAVRARARIEHLPENHAKTPP